MMYLVPVVLVQLHLLFWLKCCWSRCKIDRLPLLFQPLVHLSFDVFHGKVLVLILHRDTTMYAPHFSTVVANGHVI